MRTFTSCMQCQVENGIPNFASLGVARIPDDGVIEFTCDRGHRTFTIMQEAKYEILSELAVTALCDGYYREAVASFASALERLYEYYVDVVCRHHKIDPAAFAAAWKPLRKASERQLGAFSILYLTETGSAFPLLADKHIKFRNDVIHAGIIPTLDEAVTYGQAVGDCAAPLIALLHSERYEETRRAAVFDGLRTRSTKTRKTGARHSTQSITTPFSFSPTSTGFDLEAVLKERAKRPDMKQAVAESHALAALLTNLATAR